MASLSKINPANLGAPGVTVNEADASQYGTTESIRSPVSLIFGFSSMGETLAPKYFNTIEKMTEEFGNPEGSLEKYFLNAGCKVIEGGGTALMTRLPYDNDQCNKIKYVRYAIEPPVHRHNVYASKESIKAFQTLDPSGLQALEALHDIDDSINGYSRISLASDTVETMDIARFDEVFLDSSELEQDSIYIFDIKKKQFGTNPLLTEPTTEYIGTVPILVTASTALYVQEKIENNPENDSIFNLISIPVKKDSQGNITYVDPSGLVIDRPWKSDEEVVDEDELQTTMRDILGSFSRVLDFNHNGTFYDKKTLGDDAALQFPLIRYNSPKKLERKYLDQLGILVFEMVFNEDTEKVDFILRESFCGYIANCDTTHPPLEIAINNNSKYIKIIRKVRRSSYRDIFHVSNQPVVVFGMGTEQVQKRLHYTKSIMEPVQHMLDAYYSDIDSCRIDIILDAGLTTVAHYAWRKYLDPEVGPDNTFYFNPGQDDIKPTLAEVETCSTAWNRVVRMMTSFIETRRGECVFIADGPRMLNVSRNAPISQHYKDISNLDLMNKYLKYFSEIDSCYGARIFNWTMTTEHYSLLNIWMPPSIVAGYLIANSEKGSFPWYAPSGFRRGIAPATFRISIRTKHYTDENDFLYANRWNFFTEHINAGIVLEGNKTMQVAKTALDRLNVRRLCNYIKRQARNISNRYKYEPNTFAVRMNYREDLTGMLTYIQRNSGISEFRVICNETNNPNEVIERNELRCQIWIKPIKAIEFIIVNLNVTNQGVILQEGFTGR